VDICFKDGKEDKRLDLESVEMCIRSSMHGIGRSMLEQLLNEDNGYRGGTFSPDAGGCFEFVVYRDKEFLTVLGEVRIKRAYYHDKASKRGIFPRDKELHMEEQSTTPGVRKMVGRVGAMRPFALGEEDFRELAGLTVNAKEIERLSHELGEEVEEFLRKEAASENHGKATKFYACLDGTGVPVVGRETEGRKGR